MIGTAVPETRGANLCVNCGIPLDSKPFDESSIQPAPTAGQELVLAQFKIVPMYCGVLQFFSQFWEPYPADARAALTRGQLVWGLRMNGRPTVPYGSFDHILNPWGEGSFPVALRLDENTTLQFIVRNVGLQVPQAADQRPRVGGRIVGRYWYNCAFGDVVRER